MRRIHTYVELYTPKMSNVIKHCKSVKFVLKDIVERGPGR